MNRHRAGAMIASALVNLALLLLAIACVIPLLMIVSGSFSTESAINRHGYTLIPVEFSTLAYQFILRDPTQILRAYAVTAFVTAAGTIAGLIITAMLAYAISRRSFNARRPLSFYVFFTLLFNGGLIPFYLFMVQTMQLKNSLLALILPLLVNGWNVLILRTHFANLPEELLDAARIDGANEWRIFFQVVVPISTPVLATVSLFMMLGYWNDWWLSLLFIDSPQLYSIQYLLYNIQASLQAIQSDPRVLQALGNIELPAQTARMAMAVIAIGPIAFVYLFLQRYLVRGIMIGSIK
jgi:putative aldouronate transport system permease protein